MLFFIILLVIFTVAHIVIYRSTLNFFNITDLITRRYFAVLFIFLALSFIASIPLLHATSNPATQFYYLFSAIWTGMAINLLVAVVASWILIAFWEMIGLKPNKLIIGSLFYFLAVGISVLGIWNAFNPVIKQVDVNIDNLPENWKGKTIVQLSDVHLGYIHRPEFMEKVAAQVNALEPELILITGDLFDGMGGEKENFNKALSSLKSKRGIIFTSGNHEEYRGETEISEYLSQLNITALKNDIIDVDGLNIIGVGYPGLKKDEAENFAKLDFTTKPLILLFHTPTNLFVEQQEIADRHIATYLKPDIIFKLAKEIGVDLQLSGHTHHGQLFPFNYLTKVIYDGFDYGLHTDGNFNIYITNGVGTWGPPIRTEGRPEVVAITLK